MLQEAGFHPLEVIRSATYYGAQALHEPKGKPIEFGIVRPGLKADFVITKQNPLQNFKTLYVTGAVRLNDAIEQARARRRDRLRGEGRHPLRRQEAGRRRGGDRGGVEEGASEDDGAGLGTGAGDWGLAHAAPRRPERLPRTGLSSPWTLAMRSVTPRRPGPCSPEGLLMTIAWASGCWGWWDCWSSWRGCSSRISSSATRTYRPPRT